MNDLPPIWVLNLAKDKDRYDHMTSQLQSHGVSFEFVPGVDGRELDLAQLEEYSEEAAIKTQGRPLSPGQIGCLLSHYRIWKRIIAEDHPYVLVFEDDVEIKGELFQVLQRLDQFPSDWELINFSTDATPTRFWSCDLWRVSYV